MMGRIDVRYDKSSHQTVHQCYGQGASNDRNQAGEPSDSSCFDPDHGAEITYLGSPDGPNLLFWRGT